MFSLNSFSGTVNGYFLLWIIKTKQKSINLAFQFASFREAITVYENEECNLRIIHSRPEKSAIHKQHSSDIHLVSFQLNLLNNNLWTKTSSCHVRILGEGKELLEMKQR